MGYKNGNVIKELAQKRHEEMWPIKAKEAASCHEVRLTLLDTNPLNSDEIIKKRYLVRLMRHQLPHGETASAGHQPRTSLYVLLSKLNEWSLSCN